MIGIVTPYKTVNFGTKLQAYAMQELMQEFDEAEIINFNTKSDYRLNAILGKLSIDILKNKLKNKKIKKEEMNNIEYHNIVLRRIKAIQSFDKDNYRFSERINGNKKLIGLLKKYDTVICGSDQLWSPRNVKADWFTLSIVPNSINKISYAASFGVENIPSNMRNKYKKYLNNINSIAVREQNGKKMVEDLVNKEVTVTLDPTLMLNKMQWEKLSKKSQKQIDQPYIFCYFLGTNKDHREFAKELAKKTGCKLITMPHFKEWSESDKDFGDIKLYDVSPIDFIFLISNAKYVCTDSFHGSIFSIIFERDFFVFERFNKKSSDSTNSRIYSLLNILDLEKQLVNSKENLDELIKNKIDYRNVNVLLEIEKNKSFEYLENALKLKRR